MLQPVDLGVAAAADPDSSGALHQIGALLAGYEDCLRRTDREFNRALEAIHIAQAQLLAGGAHFEVGLQHIAAEAIGEEPLAQLRNGGDDITKFHGIASWNNGAAGEAGQSSCACAPR